MEMGSDGSLCRITSSASEHNNAVIVVSESKSEKSKGTPYKIVIKGTIQNPHESSPEVESDEELDEIVPKKIEPSIGNGEKPNTSSDKKTAVNEFKGKRSSRTNRGYPRFSPYNNNFKSRRLDKPYRNNHNSSNKRQPYPKKKPSIIYPNNSSVDICPWENPNSIAVPNYPSYPAYHQFPVTPPAIESHILNRHNCESSATSIGILGDRPYLPFPPPPQYPPRDPNVPEQHYWNDPTDNQSYWNDGHSNHYQRPIPTDRPVSEPKNFYHGKHFQQNGYRGRRNAHR